MEDPSKIPQIVSWADSNSGCPNLTHYRDIAMNIMKTILPASFSLADVDDENRDDAREQFHTMLPLTRCEPCPGSPSNLSFFLLQKQRSNSFKFFSEMVRHWMVPGKRLAAPVLYSLDFQIPELGESSYTLSEVMIAIEKESDREEMMRNLPIIESEIRLGASSSYYARRILEIKGLSSDEKTALIQEDIAYMISRLPDSFDYDIFTEMQHVLVICPDDFKAARESQHLSRIISAQYLFRKSILEQIAKTPEKRHLRLKTFRAKLTTDGTEKVVLGVVVGLNFLVDKEVLEEEHLMKAIHNYVPNACSVERSFFSSRRGTEPVGTLYLEIEKSDGSDFSHQEMRQLKHDLASDLGDRVEHLMHPVFMPRNEEEVMRNILSLSNQIKYLRDIPQVFTSFDEQTVDHLLFTIILVRVLKGEEQSIQEQFGQVETFMDYIHDRCKTVGYLRKKHVKEATVFRVKIPKEGFLRKNNSIDLTKARQAVVSELGHVVGEFRDFNGGMISKQNELLCEVRDQLDDSVKSNDLLLENFFYSLHPVVMRTVLDPGALKTLFTMLLEAIEHGFFSEFAYSLKTHVDAHAAYVMLSAEERSLEDALKQVIEEMMLHPSALVSSTVKVYDTQYQGFIYRTDDAASQQHFCHAIKEAVDLWSEQRRPAASARFPL